MGLADSLSHLVRTLRPRQRRSYLTEERAHVEIRNVEGAELEDFTRQLTRRTEQHQNIRWVEVNPHTRRVVFAFVRGSCSGVELERLVEDAERSARIDEPTNAPGAWGAEHPADVEPIERLKLELGVEVTTMLLGLVLRLSPLSPSNVAGSMLGIAALVRSTRLRTLLTERLGEERAEHALNLSSAFAQAAAQRPMSSLVDALHKRAALLEAQARRESWCAREPELCARPASHDASDARVEARPTPLVRGPIEEYTDRAWILSLAGFGVSFLTTRSLQRATGALFSALPRPAKVGRDIFCAELGRSLAARGVVVLDAAALRRLDRVDCLVLQGDLITRDKFEIGEIVTDGSLTVAAARAEVAGLFDPEHPVDCRAHESWVLGPARQLEGEKKELLTVRCDALARSGALVLALARDHSVVAIVEMKVIPHTGVEELIAAAHDAGLRVVVTSHDETLLAGLNADDVIPQGISVKASIRRLQRQGRGVCFVGTASHAAALANADVGVGLTRPGEPPPWGAHLICRSDLSDVRFLLQACTTARDVAKQSVNIALGSATLGALVSAGGIVPLTTRRVLTVVNTATLVSMANGLRASNSMDRQPVPPPRDRTPWHALDAQGALRRLGSSEDGLRQHEIMRRTTAPRRQQSAWIELGEAITDELFNPFAPLLAAGAGLSAVVGSMSDASMVGGVMALNAVVGGVQRYLTERAIRDLSRTTRRRTSVRRSGLRLEIDTAELVQGDIVELFPGDVVPADCRILEAVSLEVDASSLTGESLPVRKDAEPSFSDTVSDRTSMLYEGTSIAAGRATAVVVAAGDETEARRAAVAAPRTRAPSGVDQRLRSLINLTGPVALTSGVGLVGLGMLRGRRIQDLIGSGVSLAVASVPEGLPLLATAAQLASAKRLAQCGVLVRNPGSIEALGRVGVLCFDKTGTITEGRIDLSSVTDGTHEEGLDRLSGARLTTLRVALRATPVPRPGAGPNDPTDAALLRAAERIGARAEQDCPGWRRESELSFEAGRGYHAVAGRVDSGVVISVKGAPEVLLRCCSKWLRAGEEIALDAVAMGQLHVLAGLLAHRGLRVLAVAEQARGTSTSVLEHLDDLTFRGFLAFSDPVRPTATAALERLAEAGIKTVMLTGDHPSTARAIAAELSLLSGEVISGAELARLSDDDLDDRLARVSIFSRVTPAQKVRVVRALQRAGHVVAMVGDGANDAPAIRLADVGIALGERSTSSARGAADVVVTTEHVETIVDAVIEGRAMWSSVRDAVSILVGGNLGEIGFTLLGGLVDGRPPLSPRQLLLVNVLTDVAPAMAIALKPAARDSLEAFAHEGPDASLGAPLNRDIAARAVVTTAGAGAAWLVGRAFAGEERARTIGLLALVGTQLGQTLTIGGPSAAVLGTSVASALALAGVVQSPGLSHFFGCRPLGPLGWLTAIGGAAVATGTAAALPGVVANVADWLGVEPLATLDPERQLTGDRREGENDPSGG